jgi:cysteine desulfurase / selenocysteine lyase
MNTNIELPDIQALENLANEIFKALPNEFPKEISLNPTEHPKAKGIAETVLGQFNDQHIPKNEHNNFHAAPGIGVDAHQLPDHSFLPSSGVSGAGTTPFNLAKASSIDYRNPGNTNIQNSSNPGAARSSYSVAGSGASPSYLKQEEPFNIQNPTTGFNDPNLKGDIIHSKTQENKFPFETSFFPGMDEILSNIEVYQPNSFHEQLPKQDDFYFLNKTTSIPHIGTSLPSSPPSYYFITDRPDSNISSVKRNAGFNIDVNRVKKDFPILNEKVNGKPLIWFDNAATTQKPKAVIDRVAYFYEHENSNIHRAAHTLAARATDAYEAAREKVKVFLGAGSVNEIVFVRGATEAINLVAQSWGDQYLSAGDEIILSNLEHHANIVPWKRLADKKGIKIKVIPVDDDGQIILEEYSKLLNPQTKLVAFTQVSNALGTITPAQQMVSMAHAVGAKVLVDGAQSVSHMTVNVKALDADWFVFSGHKVFGPTGIGVLYGKEELLNQTQPWQGGGNMIQDVTFGQIKYQHSPNRFEAGTGNIADAVGLGAAIDYVSKFGMEAIGAYEHFLLEYATHQLKQVPGVRLIGTAANKASVLSFTLQGYSNDEVGKRLNEEGIAVRTGHHCAQPILRRMGVETTVRPSIAFYNTCSEVDVFIDVLHKLRAKKKY